MAKRPSHLTVAEAFRLWFTYGNRNWWEHFTHTAIACGALIFFAFGGLLVATPSTLHMPTWVGRLAAIISARLVPQDFAYMMTILASLIAAVCTGFCAILFGAHQKEKAPHGGPGLLAMAGDPLHNLGHITALVVSLFASIAATFGFAATYSIPRDATVQVPHLAAQYALAMSFLQLSISTGVVGITLIPIVNNRKEIFVIPLIVAISTIFWLPVCWLFVFLLAMPEVFQSVVPMFAFIVGAPMAQALFPHGVAVLSGMPKYRALLWSFAAWGFGGMAICSMITGLFIILLMTIPSMPEWYYMVTIRASFGILGISLLLYSIYIEGIRKVEKNELANASQV